MPSETIVIASDHGAVTLKQALAEDLEERGFSVLDLGTDGPDAVDYPDFAEAHNNRGNMLQRLESTEEALSSYATALELNPTYPEAHNNRGTALQDLERPEEALESFDKAVALKPDYAEAHCNRGWTLQELKRPQEALESYDRALSLKSDNADAFNNRGNALQDLQRPEDALSSFDNAIALRPDHPAAYSNRGNALKTLNRVEDALQSYETAIELAVDQTDNQDRAAADRSRRRQKSDAPDDAEAQWNRSLSLLLMGRFEEGWRQYEWRKLRKEAIAARTFEQPTWLGSGDLSGKTLFVHWEQGLGDTIQFCRYAKVAAERGAKVVLSVQKPLVPLMRSLSPEIEILAGKEVPEHFDCHAPLISLPLAFGTARETIPAEVPYLAAEPARVARWADHLGDRGFRIGVAWQGSTGKIDLGRSFPLSALAGIAALSGVRLISLQKNEGTEQLAELLGTMAVETLGDGFDTGDGAFLDTAAVMATLDLVITSDTAVAHLAGALGRPVWTALKQVPDWRWLLEGEECPWYPTMRLFRQQTRGDWAGVFEAMRAEIAEKLKN